MQVMRCLLDVKISSDEPFWVPRSVFYQHFDQDDFLCRESIDVVSSYLASWFYIPEDGKLRFELPAVHFVAGKTQFINGRHRTAVLLSHLDTLPIAFLLLRCGLPDRQARQLLEHMDVSPIKLDEWIELPDLPVFEQLP